MATRGTTNGFRTTAWGASALALVLFIATAALTISKVYRTDPHASFIDAFICLGPNTLLSALSGLAMLGLGLLARGRRRSIAVAVGMAVWAMLVLSLSMLAHQSWERSGTLLDWKLFSYTLQHYDELQAVIGSETSWTSWLVLGGVTLLGLLPVGLDAAYSRWPIKPPPTRAALKVLVPTAAVAAGLLFVSPSSPRVHRYARAAAPSILVGAVLESWNQAEAAAAPPPVETSILVRDKLRRHPPVRTPTETTPANLLVIVLESTRWDATTVYNPELPTTPNMVKLADRGLVPEAVYVDMPHTSKALVSTLCGYPARWVQNIEEAEAGGLNRPCLAHILDSLGYSTAFFQSATGKFENRKRLTENFGYKFFRSLENYDSRGFEQTNYLGLEDKVMVKPLLSWIDEQTGEKKPFFATMLTTISHHDYGLPTSMPFIDIVHGIASSRYNRYLNTVKYADSFIGDVVAGLEKRGLLDDTLIAIV
ncbi:MAG: LTA synthase family protein, partial [Myxococcales bacterium]|nr:LTA synthase family protein [Myxococcales bacterium]